jgi:hypothetical protein
MPDITKFDIENQSLKKMEIQILEEVSDELKKIIDLLSTKEQQNDRNDSSK